jgi:uncharacterized protein (TIGR02678 family)
MSDVEWPSVAPLLRRMLSAAEVRDPADLRLLDRHREAINAALSTLCGYRLRLDRHAARLVKAPPASPGCHPLRVKRNGERVPLDSRRFAVLWATLAVLSDGADRARLQWRLADLVDAVVVAASDAGVALDMTVADDRRRVLRDVLYCLRDELGVLELQDGDEDALRSDSWRERPALYGVDEDALDRLIAVVETPGSIDEAYAAARFVLAADGRDPRLAARRRLLARLLEEPVVYTDTLDELEQDVLSREGRELIAGGRGAVGLADVFGLQAEYRREGLLLIDSSDETSDAADRFPARSQERQCALLLAAHLARDDRLGPASQRKLIADLVRGFARTWSIDPADAGQVADLARRAGQALVDANLAVVQPDGSLVGRPAIARYAKLELRTRVTAADGARSETTIPLFA